MNYKRYTPVEILTTLEKQKIVDFLYEHLDEFGDSKSAISKSIDYALKLLPNGRRFCACCI